MVGTLEVYSFFKYQHIEDLLLTKHTPQGFRIYRALAKLSFSRFIENFMKNYEHQLHVIGVDEDVKSGYSHVALLTHAMRHKNVKILHSKLMAKSSLKYAGKSLQYRLANPREFEYRGLSNIEAILVDDIITTGSTLKEAKELLEKSGVEVLFALTLADVEV